MKWKIVMTEPMTEAEMRDHLQALMIFFNERRLDPSKACAIMGNMLGNLIIGDFAQKSFLEVLRAHWGTSAGSPPGGTVN